MIRSEDETVLTPPTYRGRLQVRAEDDSVLGFVRSDTVDGTMYVEAQSSITPLILRSGGIDVLGQNELHVQFMTTLSARAPFSIVATVCLLMVTFPPIINYVEEYRISWPSSRCCGHFRYCFK